MGCVNCKKKIAGKSNTVVDEAMYLKLLDNEISRIESRPFEECVEHYIPPTFPLSPIVTAYHSQKVVESWTLIKTGSADGLRAGTGGRSGIVFFFDEFYMRLFQRSKSFRDYFGGNLKKRGEVLLRIIQYISALDFTQMKNVDKQLYFLGKGHRVKNIRPWMYSVFVETLIETTMFVLGEDGTYDVSLSWTYVMTYIMQRMLKEALKGNILELEFSANYSTKGMQDIGKMSDTASETTGQHSYNNEERRRTESVSDHSWKRGGQLEPILDNEHGEETKSPYKSLDSFNSVSGKGRQNGKIRSPESTGMDQSK